MTAEREGDPPQSESPREVGPPQSGKGYGDSAE